ncbi:MAG: TadE family protein [bacterium]
MSTTDEWSDGELESWSDGKMKSRLISENPPLHHSITPPLPRFQRRRAENGAVLMETVIAIPIFLLLIGATVWLGDLSLNRQRLLMADRYAAWNKGNRHGAVDPTPFDISQKLFNEEKSVNIKNVRVRAKDKGWYKEVTATTKATIEMPDWTRGMITAGTVADYGRMSKREPMTGRDGPHLIVMRAGSRDESMEDVNWISVRMDNWWPSIGGGGGMGGGGGGGKFTKADKYDRFGTFENWSD